MVQQFVSILTIMKREDSIYLSVISPVYGAANLLDELVERIILSAEKISESYEIVLVDDCGPDDSWDKIQAQCRQNPKVKGLRLSRNFGQHYAISAGLDYCQGTWVIVMDCDLQDQPEEIPKLYEKAQEGYEVVLARRHRRQDKFFKKLLSRLFHATLSYLTGIEYNNEVANFGIYHEKVVKAISGLEENIRYFPAMVKWVGFRSTTIPVEHAQRPEGKSSYNLKRLLNLSVDIILSYSDKPLRMTVMLGLVLSASSLFFSIFVIFKTIKGEMELLGNAGILISIWFLAGLLIFLLGIIGLYVGKVFQGVKNRPIYIVNELVNFD